MQKSTINQKIFYIQPQLTAAGNKSLGHYEDLYRSISHFLKFGRILGLIPITGLWNKHSLVELLEFRWTSLATLTSITIISALVTNLGFNCFGLIKKIRAGPIGGNAVLWAYAARGPLFSFAVLLVYIFFFTKASGLLALFKIWTKISSSLKLKQCDIGLSKSVKIYSLLIYASTFLILLLMQMNDFPVFADSGETSKISSANISALETYYHRTHDLWSIQVEYHPSLAILLFILNLISILAWNYADLLIIVFSRALYFKFKVLVEETEKRLILVSDVSKSKTSYKLNGISWAEIRQDHLMICKLLDELESLLSPLIFLTYSTNIYHICLLLHQGLTPDSTRLVIGSVSAVGAFAHLIFRTMTVSLVASKINDYAHQISVPIQKCSSAEYCKEVERLERMIGTDALGIGGLGCFVITRAFILVVGSVIFTMEIVLLQTQTSGSSNPKPTVNTIMTMSPTTVTSIP